MLAYVFWHRPADPDAYEERLRAFHQALELPGSRTFHLGRSPYDDGGAQYEDWYPVRGWAALGELNDHAVTGARRPPHDAAAAKVAEGTAGVYALLSGEPAAPVAQAHWLAKPRGSGYATFVAELVEAAGGAAVWQRQMVLGPAPEFVVLAAGPLSLPWRARQTDPRPI